MTDFGANGVLSSSFSLRGFANSSLKAELNTPLRDKRLSLNRSQSRIGTLYQGDV